MLTAEMMEKLRTVGEGIAFLAMIVMSRREMKDAIRRARKAKAPLSIAEAPEPETGDERVAVRRSELNVLVRKVAELVRKVDELTDLVRDHQNRLEEADVEKIQVSAALRDLASVVRDFRAEVATLRKGAAA